MPNPTRIATTNSQPSKPEAGELALDVIAWNDVCHPDEEASEGCLDTDQGLGANGTREAIEPGLAGLKVALRVGSCAGDPDQLEHTDAQGRALFEGLGETTYCVSIDPSSPTYAAVLKDGAWTTAEMTSGLGIIDLTSGARPAELAFGWEFGEEVVEGPASFVDRNCTDEAVFYADVTVPVGTVFRQGESFTKT